MHLVELACLAPGSVRSHGKASDCKHILLCCVAWQKGLPRNLQCALTRRHCQGTFLQTAELPNLCNMSAQHPALPLLCFCLWQTTQDPHPTFKLAYTPRRQNAQERSPAHTLPHGAFKMQPRAAQHLKGEHAHAVFSLSVLRANPRWCNTADSHTEQRMIYKENKEQRRSTIKQATEVSPARTLLGSAPPEEALAHTPRQQPCTP